LSLRVQASARCTISWTHAATRCMAPAHRRRCMPRVRNWPGRMGRARSPRVARVPSGHIVSHPWSLPPPSS
jgi:hypothetical protein